MTGREGETFPGFFMAEEGSRIRTNERSARRRRKAMAWECRHWEFAAIYGLEEVAAREAPPAVLWRCIGGARKGRKVDALRGPHSGIACSGIFWGQSVA